MMKKFKLVPLFFIVAVITLAAILIKQTNPKELILGEWVSVKSSNVHWKFTDSKVIENSDVSYPYTIVKGASHTQCKGPGYDAVYNSDQLVLILQISEDFSDCYMIDTITKTHLELFSERSGKNLPFEKQ